MIIKYRLYIMVGLIALTCLTGCGRSDAPVVLETVPDAEDAAEDVPDETQKDAAAEDKAAAPDAQTVIVHVCGAVREPGVYELSADARVADALLAAGDFLPDADTAFWNQAAPLVDGQQIYVPTEEESAAGIMSEQSAAESGGTVLQDTGGRININTASLSQLKTLPGIGDVKAGAIIAYREAKGGFGSVEEIQQVEGIKEGLYKQICDLICVK